MEITVISDPEQARKAQPGCIVDAALYQSYQDERGGYLEALEYDGKLFLATSHGEALKMVARSLGTDIDDFAQYDVFYQRLYDDGDLHKKIKHGWFEPSYLTYKWNYYYGE